MKLQHQCNFDHPATSNCHCHGVYKYTQNKCADSKLLHWGYMHAHMHTYTLMPHCHGDNRYTLGKNIYAPINIHKEACTCVHKRTYIHIHAHTYIYIHVHIHTHIHIHVQIQLAPVVWVFYVLQIHAYILNKWYQHNWGHQCLYIYIYIYTYICIYVCVYIYMYIHISKGQSVSNHLYCWFMYALIIYIHGSAVWMVWHIDTPPKSASITSLLQCCTDAWPPQCAPDGRLRWGRTCHPAHSCIAWEDQYVSA